MGELAALSASFCWALSSLMFLKLRADLGAMELNFFKCGIAFVLLAVSALVLHGTDWVGTVSAEDATYLSLSGLAGLTIGDTFYFLALSRIGPRRTLLLGALSPPITAVLAVLFLDEIPTWGLLLGMSLTLFGVSWVIAERTGTSSPSEDRDAEQRDLRGGTLFGILAATCQGAGNVLTKAGAESLDPLQMSNIRLLAGTVTLAIALAVSQERSALWKSPVFRSRRVFGWALGATFVGTYLGIWLQVAGLSYADTAVAATLTATSPIFILPMAAIALRERPSARAIAGALIAVGGVGLLFL